MTSLLAALALSSQLSESTPDAKLIDLGDGYVRVESKTYSIEVPKGWTVEPETRWGQRKISPSGAGELGAMTAPPSQQSWDELYDTALFFVLRDESGKATPYEKVKTKRGYEAAAFSVLDEDGFAKRRYIMIKEPSKGLLALSVKIPDRKGEQVWVAHFKRMVDSALFR